MRVIILGSGSPQPSLLRSAPSVLIEEGNRLYLFDCGEGTTAQLLRAGIALENVETILFTHLHADHSLGYGQLLIGGWIDGRRTLRVFGPPGIRHFHDTLLMDLYREDIDYRLGLGRSPDGLIEAVELHELTGEGEAFRDDRVTITYCPVVHSITTLALRIDAPSGTSVVISGDTAYHEPLARFARGTDVLVHDAILPPATFDDVHGTRTRDISWDKLARGHATPEEAGRIAALAGARALVLTHLLPRTNTEAAVAACQKHFTGQTWAAEDLMEIDVPSLAVKRALAGAGSSPRRS